MNQHDRRTLTGDPVDDAMAVQLDLPLVELRVPGYAGNSPGSADWALPVVRSSLVGCQWRTSRQTLAVSFEAHDRSGELDLRAGHDVVLAVRPAHPGLLAPIVVCSQEHQCGRLTEGDTWLCSLRIEPAPDTDERV